MTSIWLGHFDLIYLFSMFYVLVKMVSVFFVCFPDIWLLGLKKKKNFKKKEKEEKEKKPLTQIFKRLTKLSSVEGKHCQT